MIKGEHTGKREKMGKDTNDFVKVAQRIVEFIYQGKQLPVYEGCMACVYPVSYKNSIESRAGTLPIPMVKDGCDIIHGTYSMLFKSGRAVIMAGQYATVTQKKGRARQRECFNITMALDIAPAEVRIVHIHISRGNEGRFYQLRDVNERLFRMHESQICYIEAGHNRVLWHCGEQEVQTVGSLQDTEKTLSEEFVRIHRSFIVNRNCVLKIGRCYVELDNGEVLPVPVKRYCEVRRNLQKKD
ncbi:MAG: LytTR family transcriptional regulator [Candidatus Gastranaerophilales bacterium]|nr:LytTR family transcriptional regulator [Candidatus Gastranaerophilales bacterium]